MVVASSFCATAVPFDKRRKRRAGSTRPSETCGNPKKGRRSCADYWSLCVTVAGSLRAIPASASADQGGAGHGIVGRVPWHPREELNGVAPLAGLVQGADGLCSSIDTPPKS